MQSYTFPTIIIPIVELNGGVFGTIKATDVYPAVDVTDLTQSPQGTTKPYQIAELIGFMLTSFGLQVYAPVLAATTINLTATYMPGSIMASPGVGATLTNNGALSPFTIDGQLGILNGRYLIKNQTSAFQNGIYILTTVGDNISIPWVLTRSIDFNQPAPPFPGIVDDGIVYVLYGTVNSSTIWQDFFSVPLVIGTTNINWQPWSLSPPQLNWIAVDSVSFNTITNSGYRADRTVTPVQFLLPSIFELGDQIIIMGNGAGGWSLIANAGQVIQFGSQTTSMAGAINSDIQYANITVRGLVNDTVWEVIETNSNPSYV